MEPGVEAAEPAEPLRLRIPEPWARPGDAPKFRDLLIDRAGEVRRPAIDVAAADIVDLGDDMIRVLDVHGDAVGPWAGTLDAEQLRRGLRDMLTVRVFDARMLQAHRQGNTSFYMQSLGEEAVACAYRRALRLDDMCFPTYRQQGLLITAGYPLIDMINQTQPCRRAQQGQRGLGLGHRLRQAGGRRHTQARKTGGQQMSRIFWAVSLSALALGLGACGEKPQELAGRQISGSAPSWQGPTTVFTVSGWKVGDERSWDAHMLARAQAQNELVRLGASR